MGCRTDQQWPSPEMMMQQQQPSASEAAREHMTLCYLELVGEGRRFCNYFKHSLGSWGDRGKALVVEGREMEGREYSTRHQQHPVQWQQQLASVAVRREGEYGTVRIQYKTGL